MKNLECDNILCVLLFIRFLQPVEQPDFKETAQLTGDLLRLHFLFFIFLFFNLLIFLFFVLKWF